jgi:hypothetical protein
MRRISLALLVAIASSGCLRSTTLIDLRPDGSGTILQETALNSQALGMMKGMAAANQPGGAPPDLFGEEQAKKTAAMMGVTFVSGEPFKTGELEGYRSRFRFDDITKIKMNMEPGASGMSGASKQPPFAFTFDRRPASSLLTIQMPQPTPGDKGPLPSLPGGMPGADDPAQAAQALAMMKMMMKGMFVNVAMNVDGRIIKTNAPHVEGSRVTLLEIDFDKLLTDETALKKLQAASASDLKAIAKVPGVKIVSDPQVQIEFAR